MAVKNLVLVGFANIEIVSPSGACWFWVRDKGMADANRLI